MSSRVSSILKSMADWVVVIVVTAVAVFLIRSFVVEPYVVPTGSMEQTILVGDKVMAQKVSIELGAMPKPGEIVVFRNPDEQNEHDVLVKRVIATPGQTVDLVDGHVEVDGVVLSEDYADGESFPLPVQASGVELSYPFTVPDGCVWVMGDNREDSADSRYFGAVSQKNLIGVVFFRYSPLSRMGAL